ncbi:dnaJ homolog subfamily C member 30, mitochondrial-like [Sebastes umbrosus]|uniref:dnaJ homolog subfamily C member 30, mitochondrial-like n=1 Tax=Sebastes umbrosus TaxID=72105 RepID=UPI00189C9695|nr:dnaJ homolog subfamily C member 30, mitochondrial-like [Sebastes umbrosus]
MAEVRLHIGRGAYNFAQKTCNRYLLESPNKRGKSAKQASSLSAGCLLGDIPNRALHGAEDRASQDSYTRVTQLFGNVNDEYYYYLGLNKGYSLSKKPQAQNIELILPLCRINNKFRRTFRQQHGQFVFIRAYSGNGSRSEPLYRSKTGYYDILEVSPTVTQAQIKTAYYKQSFMYHPDRNNASEDATIRFSEISEAYTVLGNKALRKKYDRGLLSQSDLIATARPSSSSSSKSSAKQPAENRRSVMGADGPGGVFDFDKFIKAHYNEQLQKQREVRVRKEEMLRKRQETIEENKIAGWMEMGVAVLIAMAVGLVYSLRRG